MNEAITAGAKALLATPKNIVVVGHKNPMEMPWALAWHLLIH